MNYLLWCYTKDPSKGASRQWNDDLGVGLATKSSQVQTWHTWPPSQVTVTHWKEAVVNWKARASPWPWHTLLGSVTPGECIVPGRVSSIRYSCIDCKIAWSCRVRVKGNAWVSCISWGQEDDSLFLILAIPREVWLLRWTSETQTRIGNIKKCLMIAKWLLFTTTKLIVLLPVFLLELLTNPWYSMACSRF